MSPSPQKQDKADTKRLSELDLMQDGSETLRKQDEEPSQKIKELTSLVMTTKFSAARHG